MAPLDLAAKLPEGPVRRGLAEPSRRGVVLGLGAVAKLPGRDLHHAVLEAILELARSLRREDFKVRCGPRQVLPQLGLPLALPSLAPPEEALGLVLRHQGIMQLLLDLLAARLLARLLGVPQRCLLHCHSQPSVLLYEDDLHVGLPHLALENLRDVLAGVSQFPDRLGLHERGVGGQALRCQELAALPQARVHLLELLVMDIQFDCSLLPALGLHDIAAEGPLASPALLDLLRVKRQPHSVWRGCAWRRRVPRGGARRRAEPAARPRLCRDLPQRMERLEVEARTRRLSPSRCTLVF